MHNISQNSQEYIIHAIIQAKKLYHTSVLLHELLHVLLLTVNRQSQNQILLII